MLGLSSKKTPERSCCCKHLHKATSKLCHWRQWCGSSTCTSLWLLQGWRTTWIHMNSHKKGECIATSCQQAGWHTGEPAPLSKTQLWVKGMSLGWLSKRQSPSREVQLDCRSSENYLMLCGAGLLQKAGEELLNSVCRGDGPTGDDPWLWHRGRFFQPQELFGTGLISQPLQAQRAHAASANQLHRLIPFIKCSANSCLTSLGRSTTSHGKLTKTGREDKTGSLSVTYTLISPSTHRFI